MLIRVARVRAGGELLAHRIAVRLGDALHRGLRPLLGVNAVAGVTGSGKTLLAEVLWLGAVHVLGALLGERFRNAAISAAGAYGIRPVDAWVEFCINNVEVPGLKRGVCIGADISGGVESWVAVPGEAVSEELRRSLVYALLHVISVPDRVKWRIAHALRELHGAGLLAEDVPRELCLATIALVPPVEAGRAYTPCYVRMLDVPDALELAGGEPYFYAAASHGEASYALFKAVHEAARGLSKLAREELGVSAVPIVYIDDAFENLDAAKMRELLSRDYGDVSIYAATHRLEAGMYTSRNLLMTYGTRASELVEQPPDFRFALVDASLIERHKEIFKDVSSKLLEGP